MGGSHFFNPVADEIRNLSILANVSLREFQHYLLISDASLSLGTAQTVFNYDIPPNLGMVITAIDVLSMPGSFFDPDLAGTGAGAGNPIIPVDWRSTLSINPYEMNATLLNGATTIDLLVDGQSKFPSTTVNPIVSGEVFFTILGQNLKLRIGTGVPNGKEVIVRSRMTTYFAQADVIRKLRDYETRVEFQGVVVV